MTSVLLLAFVGATTAYQIKLKGTCDNNLELFISQDGGLTYADFDDGWSPLDKMGSVAFWKTKTFELNSMKDAELKIKCSNNDGDCKNGGLIFGVEYDGTWYTTNGDNDNNGYYELTDSKSGLSDVQDPHDPHKMMNFVEALDAKWTWTCGNDNHWDCNSTCGEYNEYVFDFAFLEPCEDIQCPVNFVCDPDVQGCVRDCAVFAIDEYLRDCSAEFDANENELLSLNQRAIGLESDVARISSHATTNTDDINDNTAAISANKASITALEGNVTENQAAISANEASISTNSGDINENEGSITELQGNVTENQAAISANNALISTNSGDINENEGSITALQGNVTENQAAISANQASITTNGDGINENEASITALEGNVTDNQGAIRANDASISTNSDGIDDNIAAISANDASITNLQGNVTDNQAAISANEASISTNSDGINDNEASITALQGNVTDNQGAISANEAAISTNSGDINENEGSITALQGNVAENQAAISANEASITELAEEQAAIYTALQDKLDALQAKLDGLGPVVPAAAVEEGQRSIGIVDFNVFKEYQSELIALSIITNVIACFCLVSQRRGSKVYSPVQMYGFEDENAQSDADKI